MLVNQSGYTTAENKRFAAPLAADGTPFSIVTHPAGATLHTGFDAVVFKQAGH